MRGIMRGIEAAIIAYIEEAIRSKAFTQSLLYRVLKRDLTELGYWKNKARGNGGSFK